MEKLTQLFGRSIRFVYHSFDRIVIRGRLSTLSRPENLVYFFRNVKQVECISKEVLRQRTDQYLGWVNASREESRQGSGFRVQGSGGSEIRESAGMLACEACRIKMLTATSGAAQRAAALRRVESDLTWQRQIVWRQVVAHRFGQAPGEVFGRAESFGQRTDQTAMQD